MTSDKQPPTNGSWWMQAPTCEGFTQRAEREVPRMRLSKIPSTVAYQYQETPRIRPKGSYVREEA